MSGPTCIVCGKKIKKRMRSLWFSPAAANNVPEDLRQDCTIFTDNRPKSKEEAQRYTNYPITRVSMSQGSVIAIDYWEGEYDDPHFHSQQCAAAFGRRMARQGFR